jgi:hypothetical protein
MTDSDYVLIQFPNKVTIKDTANAYIIKRYSDANYSTLLRESTSNLVSKFNADNYLEHLRIAGLCVSDCIAGITIYFTIENTRNNYFITSDLSSMTISTLDSSDYVKDSASILNSAITPLYTPYDLNSVAVIRSNKYFT